jgi:hypothetical protein
MTNERQFLKDALYDWIAAVAADHGGTDAVIWDDGKGTRPAPPFIALQFVGSRRPGFPCFARVDADTGEQEVFHDVEKTVTLHGFGEGAFDLLQVICDSIYMAKYRDLLKARNLVVNKVSDVTEVVTEVDTGMENRAKFDIAASFIRVTVDSPGWVEHVEITPEALPLSPMNI